MGRAEQQERFTAFVHASQTRLFRVALLLTGREQDAQDVLQVAYERTLRHWARVERGGNPEAYACRVVTNLVIDGGRRRTRRKETLLADVPVPAGAAPHEAIHDRSVVLDALRALPPFQRAVVVLRVYEDLSERQTADQLGCSVGAVKSGLSRGLAALRQNLADNPEVRR